MGNKCYITTKPLLGRGFEFGVFKRLNYFIVGQVLMPNSLYSGQKPIKLVSINTPAKTKSTIPKVPEITFV